MILKILAVRDRAADVYGIPNFVPSIGSAVRGFADEINRKEPGNTLAAHPEDFDLYELGTYDDATATFTLNALPRQIAIGKDLQQQPTNYGGTA